MLPAKWRQMFQQSVVDHLLLAQSQNRTLKVHCVPQSDGSNYQVQAAGSITLIFEGAIADFAQSIEENRSRKGVACFSFVKANLDPSAQLATLHDELEWTEAERAPYYSGTWHSPEEVCDKLFVPLLRDWEGFLVTPDDFIASGERVVSLGAYSGTFKATGKAMTAPFAHAWMVRGDRISRFIQYTDTVKIREAMSPQRNQHVDLILTRRAVTALTLWERGSSRVPVLHPSSTV